MTKSEAISRIVAIVEKEGRSTATAIQIFRDSDISQEEFAMQLAA